MSDTQLDAQYETLAKGIYAYNLPNDQIKAQVAGGFAAQGYTIDRVFDDPNTGLQALGLRSIDGSKAPVLVYQGSAGVDDVSTNRDPRGVGFSQFSPNRQVIQDWLEGITNNQQLNPEGFKPDVTGQSLGGALTQWTASELPTLIGSAVSFESPGIDRSAIDRFNENGGEPDQVTHYITDGDLVSLGGEAFLPGRVVVSTFEIPAANLANYSQIKHTAGILSDFKALSAGLSPELQAFLTLFDVPQDRTLSEISVEDLNQSNFTWQGPEWQGILGKLQATNPNFAQLLDRQNVEEVRYGADGNGNADFDIAQQLSKEVPPEEVNQSTAGNDILFGTDCPNIIDGLAGNDYIRAGNGNDVLLGNEGNDALLGNDGDDTLIGGAGNDILTGGKGADLFLFDGDRLTLGVDKITDFSPDEDLIGLSRATFTVLGEDLNNSFGIVTDDAAAATSESLIVYNSNNGKLFYNPDGIIDGFGDGGQFANLVDQPALSAVNLTST